MFFEVLMTAAIVFGGSLLVLALFHFMRCALYTALHGIFGTSLTVAQVKGTRERNGWETGRSGQFKKGNTSWNKGKKFNAGGRSTQTQFKKGSQPHNTLPVGAEVVKDPDDDLVYVKISAPNKWQSKHSLLWEKHHGRKVPRQHVVIFADGDRRNFNISNLVLVHRGDLAAFNKRGYSDAPSEVRPTLLLATMLDRAVTRAQQE